MDWRFGERMGIYMSENPFIQKGLWSIEETENMDKWLKGEDKKFKLTKKSTRKKTPKARRRGRRAADSLYEIGKERRRGQRMTLLGYPTMHLKFIKAWKSMSKEDQKEFWKYYSREGVEERRQQEQDELSKERERLTDIARKASFRQKGRIIKPTLEDRRDRAEFFDLLDADPRKRSLPSNRWTREHRNRPGGPLLRQQTPDFDEDDAAAVIEQVRPTVNRSTKWDGLPINPTSGASKHDPLPDASVHQPNWHRPSQQSIALYNAAGEKFTEVMTFDDFVNPGTTPSMDESKALAEQIKEEYNSQGGITMNKTDYDEFWRQRLPPELTPLQKAFILHIKINEDRKRQAAAEATAEKEGWVLEPSPSSVASEEANKFAREANEQARTPFQNFCRGVGKGTRKCIKWLEKEGLLGGTRKRVRRKRKKRTKKRRRKRNTIKKIRLNIRKSNKCIKCYDNVVKKYKKCVKKCKKRKTRKKKY